MNSTFQVREEVLSQSGSRDNFLKKLQEENKELEKKIRNKSFTKEQYSASNEVSSVLEEKSQYKDRIIETLRDELDSYSQTNLPIEAEQTNRLEARVKELEEIVGKLRGELYKKTAENKVLLTENEKIASALAKEKEKNKRLKKSNKE